MNTENNVQTALNVVNSLRNRPNFTSVKVLAGEMSVSVASLRQVVKPLVKSGLLTSSRGRSGGVKFNSVSVENSTVSDFTALVTQALSVAA